MRNRGSGEKVTDTVENNPLQNLGEEQSREVGLFRFHMSSDCEGARSLLRTADTAELVTWELVQVLLLSAWKKNEQTKKKPLVENPLELFNALNGEWPHEVRLSSSGFIEWIVVIQWLFFRQKESHWITTIRGHSPFSTLNKSSRFSTNGVWLFFLIKRDVPTYHLTPESHLGPEEQNKPLPEEAL